MTATAPCDHDRRFGLIGLPKEANGCLACAYEQSVQALATAQAAAAATFVVHVSCYFTWNVVGSDGAEVERRVIVVQAANNDEAIAVAIEYASRTARMGPRWLAFNWTEVSPFHIPYDLGKREA